ncbi:MAG: DNA repair protein RecO, partial [Pseudomonadota bacterium]
AARPHGETAAVVELLTRHHGRHSGLVHGGRSRTMRPILQVGNHVMATWRARTTDQLGIFRLEAGTAYSASAFADPLALAALAAMTDLVRLLPERDPHANLFEITHFVLGYLDDRDVWPALYVRWELALLDELGFGLDLTACAATGTHDNLVYVSPKSGRAVSEEAGIPYADRLFRLPPFLRRGDHRKTELSDVCDGLILSGHFLAARAFHPDGRDLPEPRVRLLQRFEKVLQPPAGS